MLHATGIPHLMVCDDVCWCHRAWAGKSLWCGYAILGQRERFFFAGDTAYAPIFPQIGERYGPFDLGAVQFATGAQFLWGVCSFTLIPFFVVCIIERCK